jgi:predicted dehydrogenase/nucleoside-diphosphate-sugar epimerase
MSVRNGDTPVRIAIVGCGAVTEGFHLPVMAGHPRVVISALIDPDLTRAQRLASLYRVPTVLPSTETLDGKLADAALLATPAFLHATGSIELLRRGLHVLVEKPMALTSADARRMAKTAHDFERVLSVGLFRRLLPAVRLFRAALDAGQIGDLLNVTAEVGDAYGWQLTTLAGMQRERAGGGVLADMGPHVLDLLLYICDATPTLVHYADNGGDGVETDCAIELGLSRRGAFVPTHVELSRMRTLANTIRVEGTSGWIEWAFGERSRLRMSTTGTYVDTSSGAARDCVLEARWRDDVEQYGYEGFRTQIDDFVNAITLGTPSQLSGDSVVPSVALMEECYATRTPLIEPWFTEGLPASRPQTAATGRRPRVLVTGASGFIGARLCEWLHYSGEYDVRALIRNPGRAVRLARMPIEFAVGDLSSRADLDRALAGCDMVVHAGIGTSWRESERVAVNVDGTRNLVEAALKAGVKRFVHLSTLALYGDQVTGTITEETPINPKKEWDYSHSKHGAEQIVLDAAKRGLPAIVLRPAVVYGPHNLTIVVRPLQQLAQNRLVLVECDDVPSNTIYVDNLCQAIACSLRAESSALGQIFLLSDDDGFTWGEYFGYFAQSMGADIQHKPKQPAATVAADQPSTMRRWTRETLDLLMSAEVKALAKRVYQSNPWGIPGRWFVETFPNAVRRVASVIRPEEPFIYRPQPGPAQDADIFVIDPVRARVSSEKAARMLGFEPAVPRLRAMELTLAWARHARIVRTSARDEVAAGRS